MAQAHYYACDFPRIEYEVGDIVRLVNGDAPQRVLKIIMRKGQQYLFCQYLSGSHYVNQWGQVYHNRARSAEDFVLLQSVNCPPEPAINKEKETMTKLYQTKTEPVQYGTFLTKNSVGELVLEMKGSPGDVKAFKESDVELVVPYTVSVRQLNSGATTRPASHFQVTKGSVEKGDLFLKAGVIYAVKELDTKAHDAPALKGARLIQTRALGEAEVEEDQSAED